MDEGAKEQIAKACREILAPLVESDGGEMYLVRLDANEVHIHLGGKCAGCPGVSLTSDKVLLPVLRAASAAAKMRLVVTTGVRAPEGATRIQ